MKTIIERGASWTLDETKLLLALWGQDLVQRQTTNQKRTKEVYEKISEKFNQGGYERTADQVRTRVFNMIAEYRRILKDPSPERMKKCIFFEALHKIYQAKHMDDVKSALDDYEAEYAYDWDTHMLSERGDESISDSEANDGIDTTLNNQSTTTNNNGNNNANSSASTATNSNNSQSATSDNNGDSINDTDITNNNNAEKESTSNSHSSSAKKIKLESPKSGSSQATNSAEHATTNSKQGKSTPSSSLSTPSSNQAGPSSAPASSSATANNASSAAANAAATTSSSSSSSSLSSSSTLKHQSLLLPHGTSSANTTPINKITPGGNSAYININSTKLPIIRTNQLIGHSNGNESVNGTSARIPTTAAITSHQLYQAPVNTFDVTSSALLIDRMFAHLSRESENMREWITLEKERLAIERARRAQETEREVRRERVLIDTLLRFQEQWISYLTRLGPGVTDNMTEPPPEIKIPPPEGQSSSGNGNSEVASQVGGGTNQSANTSSSANTSTTSTTSTTTSSTGTTSTINTSSDSQPASNNKQ